MCKRKPKNLREFEPILKANGYREIRSRGSHFMYGNGKNHITVNKDLNKMVQLRLIKENNLVR
ncbi:type II toxin-antitoxin system HicA family toxin [Clostridium sp. AF50-3]|jgi:predicted RNA binding protein YcfA (HicA-like mRNA interferase family)|nr:type II toxin-antitoxin system HicA family toxin [Bacteroides nordii]RHO69810.1 type II toxin-antitoxin system HicA family toxin [Clostridium sp. AF50-3]